MHIVCYLEVVSQKTWMDEQDFTYHQIFLHWRMPCLKNYRWRTPKHGMEIFPQQRDPRMESFHSIPTSNGSMYVLVVATVLAPLQKYSTSYYSILEVYVVPIPLFARGKTWNWYNNNQFDNKINNLLFCV